MVPRCPTKSPIPTAGFNCVCGAIVNENMQLIRAKIAQFSHSFSPMDAPLPYGVRQLMYRDPPEAMVACPNVLDPPLAESKKL